MEERENGQCIQEQWHVWRLKTVGHVELHIELEEEENGQGRRKGAEKEMFQWWVVICILHSAVNCSLRPLCLEAAC